MESYDVRTAAMLKHTGRIVLFVALLLGVIVVSWRLVPKGFLPEEDQGYVMVAVETPEASSLQTTREAMDRVEAVASARPEVRSASYAAGFNMLAGIASPSSGILFLSLTDYDKRKLSAMELAQVLTDELYAAVPEANAFAFIPPSIPGLGVSSGVSVEVQDLAGRGARYLETESDKLMAALRKHPEIASVTTQYNGGVPQRHLDIDREHALIQGSTSPISTRRSPPCWAGSTSTTSAASESSIRPICRRRPPIGPAPDRWTAISSAGATG